MIGEAAVRRPGPLRGALRRPGPARGPLGAPLGGAGAIITITSTIIIGIMITITNIIIIIITDYRRSWTPCAGGRGRAAWTRRWCSP